MSTPRSGAGGAFRVFICHAYNHRDIYFALVQRLNEAPHFDWRNLSVQYDMRFGDGDVDFDNDELRAEIGQKIADCDVFLALTKPLATRRRWLQWEITRAKELGKPIIGIARKRNDRVSAFVRQHATDIVDTWRVDHIVNAIKIYGKEYRESATSVPEVIVPSSLPEEQPDVDLSPEPTPPAPDEATTGRETADLPKDVIFKSRLEDYVPGTIAAIHQGRQPRWWWPFSRDGKR